MALNYDEITRRMAQGLKVTSEEFEYVHDVRNEEARMKQEDGKPQLGDYRLTVIGLRGDQDMGGSTSRCRVVFKTWSYTKSEWVPPHKMADILVAQACAAAGKQRLHWRTEAEIAEQEKTDKLGAWLATRLTGAVEREPGVWEFAAESRSSD